MNPSRLWLLLLAVPSAASGFVVLSLANVSARLWLMQAFAIFLACIIAAAGTPLSRLVRSRSKLAFAVLGVAFLGLAAPLFSVASGPARWLSFGGVNVYVAPVLLPAFLVALSVVASREGRVKLLAFVGAVGMSVLLAFQPDASQVLALLIAVVIVFIRTRVMNWTASVAIGLIVLAVVWAFSQPDPLAPVAHVEGIFRLTLSYSVFVGIATIFSALILVGGLVFYSFGAFPFLSAVASYYAVLFICSVAELTPAPFVGYGAGPVIGFGLMAAISGALAQPHDRLTHAS
jgi:hypothetical protein